MEIEISITGQASGRNSQYPGFKRKGKTEICAGGIERGSGALQSFGADSASYGVRERNGCERTDEGGLWPTQRNARMLPVVVLRLATVNIAVRTARELQTRLRSFVFAGTTGAPGRLPRLIGNSGWLRDVVGDACVDRGGDWRAGVAGLDGAATGGRRAGGRAAHPSQSAQRMGHPHAWWSCIHAKSNRRSPFDYAQGGLSTSVAAATFAQDDSSYWLSFFSFYWCSSTSTRPLCLFLFFLYGAFGVRQDFFCY